MKDKFKKSIIVPMSCLYATISIFIVSACLSGTGAWMGYTRMTPETTGNWWIVISCAFLTVSLLVGSYLLIRDIIKHKLHEMSNKICSNCHRLYVNEKWINIEDIITCSHGICEPCEKEIYPNIHTNK
jgi:hypothetical protein